MGFLLNAFGIGGTEDLVLVRILPLMLTSSATNASSNVPVAPSEYQRAIQMSSVVPTSASQCKANASDADSAEKGYMYLGTQRRGTEQPAGHFSFEREREKERETTTTTQIRQ